MSAEGRQERVVTGTLLESCWPWLAVLLLLVGHWLQLHVRTIQRPSPPQAALQFQMLMAFGALALALVPARIAAYERPSWRTTVARSALGLAGMAIAALVYTIRLGAIEWPTVFGATTLGLIFGPLALFEGSWFPRTTRGAIAAAGLAGIAALIALVLVDANLVYVERSLAGEREALPRMWVDLTCSAGHPSSTLEAWGWSALPAAATTWGRLRGWPVGLQVALALSASGAASGAFQGITAISFLTAALALTMPVVAFAADRAVARLARPPALDSAG